MRPSNPYLAPVEEEFPDKHGPEIMHENLWDECKRDIASTQKDLHKVSKQCPSSAAVSGFDTLLSDYEM